MKKRYLIFLAFLLVLFIKPLMDINYSGEGVLTNYTYAYSGSNPCLTCQQGNHASCPYLATYACGVKHCCEGLNVASNTVVNHTYTNITSTHHYVVCTYCGTNSQEYHNDNITYRTGADFTAWWQPGTTCAMCGYTCQGSGSSGGGTTVHTHNYTNYVSKDSTNHFIYCSCGAYILEHHDLWTVGYVTKCSKCDYVDRSTPDPGTGSNHTHIYAIYEDYNSTYHKVSCTALDASKYEEHTWIPCCANGQQCGACGRKNHTNCHQHSYTYRYVEINNTSHYAYCSCGASITENHDMTYCCANGNYCTKCGHKDHKSEPAIHTHNFTARYVSISATKHDSYCVCGVKKDGGDNHNLVACDCGKSGAKKCSYNCGYRDHTCHYHSYTSYATLNTTNHKKVCSCGDYITEPHDLITLTCGYKYCTKCTYTSGSHSYTDHYVSYSSSSHYAYCSCGANTSQSHSLTSLSGCGISKCSKNCGYTTGSHKYTTYTNNGDSGHTKTCACGQSSISEAHSLTVYSCGYKYCTLCTYTSGSHRYVSRYEQVNENVHKSYCFCGAYISESHTWETCCYNGKKCTYCGYKDHDDEHVCSYNYAYEFYSMTKHKAFCRCGNYILVDHTWTQCCANGQKCVYCGVKDHGSCEVSHTHSWRYENYDDETNHKMICTNALCGIVQLENHTFNSSNVCTKCGYTKATEAECTHNYSYENYGNADDHKVSCTICSKDLGTEQHVMVYCCLAGLKCSKCGYKDHASDVLSHVHNYTAAYLIKNDTVHEAYCICNQYIEENHTFSGIRCTKCGYEKNFTPGIAGGDPNSPIIPEGSVPVKPDPDTGGWIVADTTDPEWYDYYNQKWANITLRDGLVIDGANASVTTLDGLVGKKVLSMGSMFVWIPRFTYKNNGNGNVSIYFSNGTNDYTSNYYVASPAFFYGEYLGGDPGAESSYVDRNGTNNELAGIWVAKYMASNTGSHIDVKPSKNVYTSDVNTLFTLAKNMALDSSYGLTSGANSHMMKASEWSAIEFLAAGAGQIPFINNKQVTGYASNGLSANTTDPSYVWDSELGVFGSTTYNKTGIFDLSGTTKEYLASFITVAGNDLINGAITETTNRKDVDRLDASSAEAVGIVPLIRYKLGIADVKNWCEDAFITPSTMLSVVNRGGEYNQGAQAGLFALDGQDGNSPLGFRPVLLVFELADEDDVALIESEVTVMAGGSAIINVDFKSSETWSFGKTLGQVFTADGSGKRVISLYTVETEGTSAKNYNINASIVGIVKNGTAMTTSQINAIGSSTTMDAGSYQIKVSIGGSGVFTGSKKYNVVLEELNLKHGSNDIHIPGISYNVVKINCISM